MASSKELLAWVERASLDADRAFAGRLPDPPRERTSAPVLHLPPDAPVEARLEAACHWLVASVVRPGPGEVRRPMRWMPATQTPTETDCLGVSVVQAVGAVLTLHVAFDDDRGIRMHSATLNGLFGFLQAVVWPMWVNDACGRRLRVEPRLAPAQQDAVARFEAAEEEERQAAQRRLASASSFWNLRKLFGPTRLQSHERFRGQAQQLRQAASLFYAEEFRQFAQSPQVRALDAGLFAPFRLPDSRRYEELVEELASTRQALPLPRQVAAG